MHLTSLQHLSTYLLALFCTLTVYSQSSSFEIEYPHSNPTTEIKIDSLGYFWFHDNKDFYRYNGHQVEPVQLGTLLGKKKHDYIMYNDIIFVKDSLLFMNDNKLSVVQPKSQTMRDVWQLPENKYFSFIYQDENKHIWVITASRENDERTVYYSEDYYTYEAVFDLSDYIGNRAIFWDFFELDDKDGHLYFLWRRGDLLILDKTGNEIQLPVANQKAFDANKSCSQFRLDNRKRLWRFYGKQFEILNPDTGIFETHPSSNNFEFSTECKQAQDVINKKKGLPLIGSLLDLRFIYTDSKDRIWMGCAASYLLVYDPKTEQFSGLRAELVDALGGGDNDVKSIMEDSDGIIWGNKTGGLFKIKDKTSYFDDYLVNTAQPNHQVYQNKEDPTLQKILNFYNDYAIRNTSIHSIAEDEFGNIIIQEGVYTYSIEPSSGEITLLPIFVAQESVHLSYNEHLKLFASWNNVYKINSDASIQKTDQSILMLQQTLIQKNGTIWVLGLLDNFNYLFGQMDSETFLFKGNYTDSDAQVDLSINKANYMDEDEYENLWIATDEGILSLNTEENKFSLLGVDFLHEDKMIKIGAITTYVDCISGHKLWFVTKYEIGLIDLNTNTLIHYLPINESMWGEYPSISAEGDSALWIGNKDGIIYHNFNSDRQYSFASDEGIKADGAVRILKKLSSGKIAAGTQNGLYVFDPQTILDLNDIKLSKDRQIKFKVSSYSILDGKTALLEENTFVTNQEFEINLQYNDKMLELEYALLDFNRPSRHVFSTYLEGYDFDWSIPTTTNISRFTSIPPGEYIFRARATAGSGVWSDEELAIPVNVKQAWFRSWWFILALMLFLIGCSYILTKYYYQQQLQKREALEKLRIKISSDLHDDVGSVLAGVSMQSEILSLGAEDPLKAELLKLNSKSRMAMEKMRDIVWAMDSRRDKFLNLKDRMSSFAISQFQYSDIEFTFEMIGIDKNEFISPDIRQNLYFIFKEAITNALKHSTGDLVEILLAKKQNRLTLSVKDNGSSYNNLKKEGLGLSNIKMRADRINASVYILTDPGFEVKVDLVV